MKKFFSCLISGLLACISIFCFSACSETKTNVNNYSENPLGLDFYLLEDETYGVKVGRALYYPKVEIPSSYNGKPVTKILNKAWVWPEEYESNLYVNEIIIPNSVTSIGWGAFENCKSLMKITIPNSVTSILSYAFNGCDSLKYNEYDNGLYLGNDENPFLFLIKGKAEDISECVINDNCKYISDSAFCEFMSLTSITIPNSVTSIGKFAFHACHLLTTATIPDNVTKIDIGTFLSCKSLISVTIGSNVKDIGDSAFSNCSSLTDIIYNDTISQWQAIPKVYTWNDGVPSTCIVHCTNGDINI